MIYSLVKTATDDRGERSLAREAQWLFAACRAAQPLATALIAELNPVENMQP